MFNFINHCILNCYYINHFNKLIQLFPHCTIPNHLLRDAIERHYRNNDFGFNDAILKYIKPNKLDFTYFYYIMKVFILSERTEQHLLTVLIKNYQKNYQEFDTDEMEFLRNNIKYNQDLLDIVDFQQKLLNFT